MERKYKNNTIMSGTSKKGQWFTCFMGTIAILIILFFGIPFLWDGAFGIKNCLAFWSII